MQAVLYIGHGSRVEKAADEAIRFMKKGMKQVDIPIQEYCFLELSKPDILQGVQRCVDQGATRIAAVPILLLTAAHAKKDIPLVLEKAKELHPHIEFSYGRPLGVHDMIIDVLMEKTEDKKEITPDLNILLVGRGSSDQEAVQDINTIARMLDRKIDVHSVSTCFLAAAKPRFEEKVKEITASGAKNVIILPYLLFTGILMNGIEETVRKLSLDDTQEVKVCDYIGDHQNIYHLLRERVIEAVEAAPKISPQ